MKYWCHLHVITAEGSFCRAQEACVECEVFMQYCTQNNRIECPYYVGEDVQQDEVVEEENDKILRQQMFYDIRC